MPDFLGYGSPEALEAAIKQSEAPSEEFVIYAEGLLYASVCSSLPIEDVKRRMAAVVCGTKGGWQLSEESFSASQPNPSPCDQKPATHKHYLFGC